MTLRSPLVVALAVLSTSVLVGACTSTVDSSDESSATDSTDSNPSAESCRTTDRIAFTGDKTGLGGQCLKKPALATPTGSSCVVISAWKSTNGACRCDPATGRSDVRTTSADALALAKQAPEAEGADCFCEITELHDGAASTCETDPSADDQAGSGFCYVDPDASTATAGTAAVARECPASESRLVRFVGTASERVADVDAELRTVVCDVACD